MEERPIQNQKSDELWQKLYKRESRIGIVAFLLALVIGISCYFLLPNLYILIASALLAIFGLYSLRAADIRQHLKTTAPSLLVLSNSGMAKDNLGFMVLYILFLPFKWLFNWFKKSK